LAPAVESQQTPAEQPHHDDAPAAGAAHASVNVPAGMNVIVFVILSIARSLRLCPWLRLPCLWGEHSFMIASFNKHMVAS